MTPSLRAMLAIACAAAALLLALPTAFAGPGPEDLQEAAQEALTCQWHSDTEELEERLQVTFTEYPCGVFPGDCDNGLPPACRPPQ